MNARRRLSIALGAAPFAGIRRACAQALSEPVRRIGVIAEGTREQSRDFGHWTFAELARLGWLEGRNLSYEIAAADWKPELLPRVAADLASRPLDVVLAGSPAAALAIKRATATIPIVFFGIPTPVETGLVASLARPGGNVTGVSGNVERLLPKRIQLLRDILPHIRRVGVLRPGVDAVLDENLAEIRPMLARSELAIVTADVTDAASVEPAFARLVAGGAEAIVDASTSPLLYYQRDRVVELAGRARVPFVGVAEPFARAGALFSYGGSVAAELRIFATLIDRVLRGANPAEMPVESVDEYDFVVNLRTARTLGIDVPRTVLVLADRVIE